MQYRFHGGDNQLFYFEKVQTKTENKIEKIVSAAKGEIGTGIIPRRARTYGDGNASLGFQPWFKQNGRWKSRSGYTPKRGNLIFFEWGSGLGESEHVGIVTSVSGNTVYTIEGNKSSMGGRAFERSELLI